MVKSWCIKLIMDYFSLKLGNWKIVKSIEVLKVKCYQIWVSQTYLLLDKYAHSKNSCQDLNCKNCLEVTNFGKTGGISSWCHQPKNGWNYFWSFIWFLISIQFHKLWSDFCYRRLEISKIKYVFLVKSKWYRLFFVRSTHSCIN